jgi:hypothetical protein
VAGVDLTELQRLVVEAVTRPDPIDQSQAPGGVSLLRPSARGMTRESRMEVYREQFWLRHVASLAEDFPTLRAVLGPPSFEDLLRSYLRASPPRDWNLQRLGHGVAEFVASRAPWHDDALAHDAALLDWAFMEVFDAPDAARLDLGAIAAAPPDAWPLARITFLPALRHVATAHPVVELRESVRRGDPCQRPARSPSRSIVWRDAACFLHAAEVDPVGAELMVALHGGQRLGEACAAVASAHPGIGAEAFDASVGAWFQQWTANGWLSAVEI